jgi:hypothetical protein
VKKGAIRQALENEKIDSMCEMVCRFRLGLTSLVRARATAISAGGSAGRERGS